MVTFHQVFSQTTAFRNICRGHALSIKEEVTREWLKFILESINLAEDRWKKFYSICATILRYGCISVSPSPKQLNFNQPKCNTDVGEADPPSVVCRHFSELIAGDHDSRVSVHLQQLDLLLLCCLLNGSSVKMTCSNYQNACTPHLYTGLSNWESLLELLKRGNSNAGIYVLRAYSALRVY
ncbi:hypothetical protein AV530_005048 [Patagioenas fasciata monilis]|uniref:Uncharacterized protein n=1 Tax=Patagioenas fasciata monilis TaxID=372326 RepID=A0A1V4K3T3_PATFA|nr:hypothetical protein AV530_005048 [Patagioenas fasciata monilis]